MAGVFVSYQRQDAKAAAVIALDLERSGFQIEIDQRIPIGASWDRDIEKAIGRAGAVVVLWSKTSVESDWVRREARFGARRKVLCPAVIDACTIPLEFSDLQAADLRFRPAGDRSHVEWLRLVEAITETLARGPAQAPSDTERLEVGMMFQLALMHLRGDGAPKDETLARNWFDRAAAGGHAMAKIHLAAMCDSGLGGRKDAGKAKTLLEQAAASSDEAAANIARQLLASRA